MSVEENEVKKWYMIDFKKSKKGESVPFTVQYKDSPAYVGCFMSQNKKQEKVKAKPRDYCAGQSRLFQILRWCQGV